MELTLDTWWSPSKFQVVNGDNKNCLRDFFFEMYDSFEVQSILFLSKLSLESPLVSVQFITIKRPYNVSRSWDKMGKATDSPTTKSD